MTQGAWLRADQFILDTEDTEYLPDEQLLGDPAPKRQFPWPDWHEFALCAGADEATFFGARDTTERPAVSMTDIANAKAICEDCPVYETCLGTALGLVGENREEYGIWAGTSGRTRKRIFHLVDEDGFDLADIFEDILEGNLHKYETTVSLVPIDAKILPFPGKSQPTEVAA